MKIWKLVSGILSMVFFAIVVFQSCAAGLSNALESNGETSGTAGVFVAIFLLAGGIVSVATRNSGKKGANIALFILYGLAAIVGFAGHGSYSDLSIWAGWCLICAILAIVAMIGGKKKGSKDDKDSTSAQL
ncbi:MAG: hypothetical protein PUE58_06735 [Lachnospiraceae bacterium]|nr:hypothetical protein [Lachnospiraceae bacterium]